MKKFLALFLVLVISIPLYGCCISHDWEAATCTEPKTCTKCNKTEGEALGHVWEEATCTVPKTCSVCGKTEGKRLGHKAPKANCTDDAICTVCGEVAEKATGHLWKPATFENPMTCSKCGLTDGEPRSVSYFDISFPKFMSEFNQQFTDIAKIVPSTIGGLDIESPLVTHTLFGNKYYLFDADEFEENWDMSTSDINLEKFNLLKFRYVSEYGNTKVDETGFVYGLYLPAKAAVILDNSHGDFSELLAADLLVSSNVNAIDADGSFESNNTSNGYIYTFESYISGSGEVKHRVYDFTITLAANH